MSFKHTLLYKDLNSIDNDFNEINILLNNIELLKDKLDKNLSLLINYYEILDYKLNNLYVYSYLLYSCNMNNNSYIMLYKKVCNLLSDISIRLSFIYPELLSYDYNYLKELINTNYKEFNHFIDNLFREKRYIFTNNIESIINKLNKPNNIVSDMYDSISVLDNKKRYILYNNKRLLITSSNYISFLSNILEKDIRKKVFDLVFVHYKNHCYTYSNLYNLVLSNINSIRDIRGYNSILEYKLYSDNIDINIYYKLIEVAKKYSYIIKDYYKFKKEYFGLVKLDVYDLYLNLTKSKKYSFSEAKDLFLSSISFMPDEYKKFSKLSISEGFIDYLEKDKKQSGAFSISTKDYSFIQMNFVNNLESVYTLAHEAGHSTHSYFSNKYQNFINKDYTIFIAEIASLFNEISLSKNNNDISFKEEYINTCISTFTRQVLFSEFELICSKMIEEGKTLTPSQLEEIFINLYKEYYDIDITNCLSKYLYAYIPHIYHSPFYVYQYASSIVCANFIFNKIKKDNSFSIKYIDMLKKGGSDYSPNLIKNLGINLLDDSIYKEFFSDLEESINILKESICQRV